MTCDDVSKSVFLFCFLAIAAPVLVASASLPQHFYTPINSELSLALIQGNARVHQARLLTNPDPVPPRMYVSEGCDGSTALMIHAVRILRLHGIDGGDEEIAREALGGKTSEAVVRIKDMQDMYRSYDQTLVFKSIMHRDLESTTNQTVVDLGGGTLAVYVTRRNLLDQVVCMIRDCFVYTDKDSVYGYAVNSDGTPSDLCFERRETQSDAGKAKLRINEAWGKYTKHYLQENLEKAEQRVTDAVAALKKAGYAAPKIASEDLEAFEAGGDKNQEISVKAWTQLLEAWGVDADSNKLKKYLSSYANTWSPKSQKETIHNYEEVVKEIKRMGKTDLLRDE